MWDWNQNQMCIRDSAKQLLTTTSMRIMEVSECVGFADESYFSKVFKKQTGVSPADYAKTQEIAQHN